MEDMSDMWILVILFSLRKKFICHNIRSPIQKMCTRISCHLQGHSMTFKAPTVRNLVISKNFLWRTVGREIIIHKVISIQFNQDKLILTPVTAQVFLRSVHLLGYLVTVLIIRENDEFGTSVSCVYTLMLHCFRFSGKWVRIFYQAWFIERSREDIRRENYEFDRGNGLSKSHQWIKN